MIIMPSAKIASHLSGHSAASLCPALCLPRGVSRGRRDATTSAAAAVPAAGGGPPCRLCLGEVEQVQKLVVRGRQ